MLSTVAGARAIDVNAARRSNEFGLNRSRRWRAS